MTPPSPALSVMLVDDQAPRMALLEQALSDQGFRVVAKLISAAGLIAAVRAHEPDVIIIDIDSPDRDTLDAMASLHRDAPRPVVMFTADG
ncbi:MAG: response regulator, partial [Paraperlucidibaca sp.]|nr:response regulator [Paraperlucidibaca sp.]